MPLTASQREVLAELQREYDAVFDERRQRDLRLAQLQTAINALVALDTDEPVIFTGGLANACRAALKNAGRPLTPIQIRDAVIALGYDASGHTNLLASIHSVVKRLYEAGDVKQLTTKENQKETTVYLWTGEAQTEHVLSTLNKLTEMFAPDSKQMQELATALDSLASTTARGQYEELRKSLENPAFKQMVKEFERASASSPLAQAVERLSGIKPKK